MPTTPTIGWAAVLRAEQLDDAFFGQLLESLAKLLGFHRVVEPDAAKDFGGEIGDTDEIERFVFRQRVADAERAVVGDADDVAGKRLLGDLAVAGEKELRRMQRDLTCRCGPGAAACRARAGRSRRGRRRCGRGGWGPCWPGS